MKLVLLCLLFFTCACGREIKYSAPGFCYHLVSDEDVIIFRPCENSSDEQCVTKILGTEEAHRLSDATTCESCLASSYPPDDLDVVCEQYHRPQYDYSGNQ